MYFGEAEIDAEPSPKVHLIELILNPEGGVYERLVTLLRHSIFAALICAEIL